jgi:hypothetical protein
MKREEEIMKSSALTACTSGVIDFNYVSFGNPDFTQTPPSGPEQGTSTRTQSLVSTGALLFVRWYFL